MNAPRLKRPSPASLVTLAVRISRTLHRQLKVHCVAHERQIQDFVTEAVAEKLAREVKRAG